MKLECFVCSHLDLSFIAYAEWFHVEYIIATTKTHDEKKVTEREQGDFGIIVDIATDLFNFSFFFLSSLSLCNCVCIYFKWQYCIHAEREREFEKKTKFNNRCW